jgi:hypothetical protein
MGKITAQDPDSNPSVDDLILTVDTGTGQNKKVTLRDLLTFIGATGGDITGPASSVDSELALFSGTTGKVLKRASSTGIVNLTSGVLGILLFKDEDDLVSNSATALPSQQSVKAYVDALPEIGAGTDITISTVTGLSTIGISTSARTLYRTKATTIQVTDGATTVTTGDGKAYFRIPTALDAYNLLSASAAVLSASTSGTVTIQISRGRQASAGVAHTFVDMLSTRITIDANEYDSKDATASVVDIANDDLLAGDVLRIDVDVAGTSAAGLLVSMTFQAQ